MGIFRPLLVATLIVRAVALFATPYLHGLFSADTLELMRYSGHGARVNVHHPALWLLYLLPFPAYVLMIARNNVGRVLFATYLALLLMSTFFFGVSVSGPPETFVSLLAVLLDGMIFGLAFLAPGARTYFSPEHRPEHR